ncbi:MAG: RNA 2',3'-cyclic phosphodiesterase [Planctomycetes bacterium]|nr:RNA 2',3'-cyclic phosphodiesterase [Planctomycetota bacterium]
MRCFLALDLPAPVRNYLDRTARESLRKGKVKWVVPDQLHVTLVFAGEVEGETASALRDAMLAVAARPLTLALNGLGHFPPRGEPRVIWAGLSGDTDDLVRLQDALATRAEAAGVTRDKRPFTPHITLGRVKSPFGAYAIPDELQEVGPTLRDKPFVASRLTLYESELSRQGSIYRVVARRDL